MEKGTTMYRKIKKLIYTHGKSLSMKTVKY